MTNAFQELLLVSLKKVSKLSYSLSEDDWVVLYNEAEKQSLVGVLWNAIEKLPFEQHPPLEILMEWVGQTERIKYQNNLVNKRISEVSLFFQNGGFRSTVLKGQGTALLYPEPEYRQSGDIDLWVEGDRNKVLEYAKTYGNISSIDIKHADFHCFDDVSVEIHSLPTWFYSPIVNNRLTKWISLVQNNQFNKKNGFGVPTVKFSLVYSLIHIYRHQFEEGVGLRQLMDYYYILMHSTEEERLEAFSYLCRFGMTRFVGAVMYVQNFFFHIDDTYLLCAPSKKYGMKLLNGIIKGGNFGRHNDKNFHGIENRIQRGMRNIRHNLDLLFDYPSEVLWSPFWKCWHWCWRKTHGYL